MLEWQGEIRAATAHDVAATTQGQLLTVPTGMSVIVDLTNVRFVDSAGIGMMLKLKKELWRRNVKLTYRGPTEAVRNVLRMTKLESYLLEADA